MSAALVLGLGNPGPEYARTRHNAGWRCLDAWAARLGASWSLERRFRADVARATLHGRTIWLAKPLTYMNDSGPPARALLDFHKLAPADVVAVFDELNLPIGRVKVSVGGSDGGHNGVASLLAHLGDGFVRYRIGIAPTRPRTQDLASFVLSPFATDEETDFSNHLPYFVDGLHLVATAGPAAAMNRLNQRPPRHDNHPTPAQDQASLPRDPDPGHPRP